MSNISTIYDKLREQVPLIITGKTEIPNPYSLNDNMVQFLENGWGVVIGEGSQGALNVYCLDSELRIFTVIVTKLVYNLDGTNTNIVAASKTLLEDMRKVRNDLLAYDLITIPGVIKKVSAGSASGINFVQSDKAKLFYVSLDFEIEYTENILNS